MGTYAANLSAPVANPPPGDGGMSDAAIDQMKGLVELLDKDNLGSLYTRWASHPGADQGQAGNWKSVPMWNGQDQSDLDKLRGINIGSLKGVTGRLDTLSKVSGDLSTMSTQMGGALDSAWNSSNSSKAVDKFTDLTQGANAAKDSAAALSTHAKGIHDTMKGIADKFNGYRDQVCAKGDDSRPGSGGIIDKLGWIGNDSGSAGDERGDRVGYIDQMDKALKWGMHKNSHHPYQTQDEFPDEYRVPISGADLRTAGKVDIGDSDWTSTWSDEKCRELDDICARYCNAIKGLRGLVKDSTTNIDTALSNLNSAIKGVNTDPFGKLVAPGDTPPPGSQPPPKKQETGGGTKHSPPPQTHGPSQSGGAPTSTAGAGGSPVSMPPSMPGGGTPAMPGGGTPSMPGGVDPTTGMTSPAGMPGTPGMPGVGTPGTPGMPVVPAQPAHPETVTVKGPDGHDIQMTSPDGQGHMKLTVDDGSGHPKSYDVDFGQGQQAGQPGAHAVTDATGQPGVGQPLTGSSPAGSGVLGQQGMPGADGSQHVAADASGHAVIHDGQNTITVDKGADGAVKVSVDDGSGHPTSYTMDSSGSASGAASPLTGGGVAQPATSPLGDSGMGGGSSGGGSGIPDDTGVTNPAAIQGGGGSTGGAGVAMAGAGGDAMSGPGVATSGSSMQAPGQGGYTGSDPSMMGQHDAGAGVAHAGGAPAAGPGGPGVAAPGGDQAGGGGGMPMMGGGMGGGAGGGGDLERGGSSWRTEGNLFDDVGTAAVDEIEELLTGNDPNRR